MRKYKYAILSIFAFMLIPNSIKGAVCKDSDKVNYQSLAKNISISYDYKEEGTKAKFNLTFSNIPEGFYLVEYNSEQNYPYVGSEITIPNLSQGRSFKFEVYTTSLGCDNIVLYTHYVTLPYYNPYYTDSLCDNIKNYKYCNKWVNKKITYSEFKENVEKYRNNIKKEEIKEEEKQTSLFDTIISFYLDYYYIILPIIILTGIVTIRRSIRKQDLF